MAVLTSSQIVLEWSADPLSDTTPTYVTVSNSEIRGLEWWAGIDREGNDPEPGGMVVTLKNTSRKWEPLFASNTIDQGQRFRLTVDGVAEGIFYSQDFEIDWPSGQDYSEVTVTCGDGFDVLALDDLLTLDPPEADSYEDVVNFDEPWGYWRLGEPEGTQAVAQVRRVWRGKGKKRRKVKIRTRSQETIAEAGGVAGPAGTYKNTPALGQEGLILGDTDTAVLFASSFSEYVRFPLEDTDTFSAREGVTVETWLSDPSGAVGHVVSGPVSAGASSAIFWLALVSAGAQFVVPLVGGSIPNPTSTTDVSAVGTFHVVGTYDGQTARIYVNGVEEAAVGGSGNFHTANANEFVYIGQDGEGANFITSTVDEVAIYEYALSAERILAHYEAGAERGFPMQTAGERVEAIADNALWSTSEIQTSGRDVLPIMQHGQSRLDEIGEAAHAEGPRTLFFFNGDGDPVYLGHEFQASAAVYNTVQATFNDDGTGTPYNHVDIVYDNEVYNEVLASHEAGASVIVTDAASQAKRGRRVRTEETDLLLMEHNHVESLATHVLDLYSSPAMRPVSVTIDGHHALAQIKALDIGHKVRVKKSGVTGDPIDRVTHIIGKRKSIDLNRLYTTTYTLARGFDGSDGYWHLGVTGFSELGTTTTITG